MSGLISRLTLEACCGKLCNDVKAWCDQCMVQHVTGEDPCKHRGPISKKDIQPLILHQPSVTDLDLSAISNGDAMDCNGTLHGTSGLTPNGSQTLGSRQRFGSTENSPHYLEADSHSFASSRKSSISSSSTSAAESRYRPPLSPAPPVIDMKPIEFWACTSRESVQPPRSPRHRIRQTSEGESSIQGIRVDLYGGGGGGGGGDGGAAAGGSSTSPDTLSEELGGGGGGAGGCSSGAVDDTGESTSTTGQGNQLGRVHVGIHYDVTAACLYVRVIEARDLPPPSSIIRDESSLGSVGAGGGSAGSKGSRGDISRSNSYARVRLLPDDKASMSSYQTSVQRKTQNPIWEEQFAFAVPFADVQEKAVEVVVKDFDKYSRHYLIGCTTLSLDSCNILKGIHLWKHLEPCTKGANELGEIQLALNFLPAAGRLNIDVISAKQLLQTDLSGRSDPFVKVSVFIGDKLHKTRRTSTVCHTIDPIFNESLSFNVAADQIDECTVVVSVWDHNSKSRDELIGRLLLGRQSSGSKERAHWSRLLKGGTFRSPSASAQWHTLHSREDCDTKCSLSLAVQ